jgi:hypothetical protein
MSKSDKLTLAFIAFSPFKHKKGNEAVYLSLLRNLQTLYNSQVSGNYQGTNQFGDMEIRKAAAHMNKCHSAAWESCFLNDESFTLLWSTHPMTTIATEMKKRLERLS